MSFHYRDQIPEGLLVHLRILRLAVVVLCRHLLYGALPCPVPEYGRDHVIIRQVDLWGVTRKPSYHMNYHKTLNPPDRVMSPLPAC